MKNSRMRCWDWFLGHGTRRPSVKNLYVTGKVEKTATKEHGWIEAYTRRGVVIKMWACMTGVHMVRQFRLLGYFWAISHSRSITGTHCDWHISTVNIYWVLNDFPHKLRDPKRYQDISCGLAREKQPRNYLQKVSAVACQRWHHWLTELWCSTQDRACWTSIVTASWRWLQKCCAVSAIIEPLSCYWHAYFSKWLFFRTSVSYCQLFYFSYAHTYVTLSVISVEQLRVHVNITDQKWDDKFLYVLLIRVNLSTYHNKTTLIARANPL